ncbi:MULTISPECIES: ParB N-terminal domain-containing protein [Agrobacterium]|uniref:ParB N-terminal domain-containing protein n=1 Tax=Agrobacterium TaxID=357 RepID=UPI0022BACBA9|nr:MULTISPECIES: ParB N-terminal domain-containing protein [Agrobacterium]MCZ7866225.1 ParB N-terminal domain-containing protein [Agrobacterium salinitolerans]MDA5639228.1 ParB N-terminal domain-containing protein [Agrobacterium sp. ST15.13.013]MDA6999297.1 ParB N-terminal domain-containing protein [Agrobacterium salinitolerans]
MQIMKVDPRALKENPDRMRQTKSSPQADALMLATIKAVGIVQPPVVAPETGGGNGYIIDAGHRRVRLAIAAGLEEIEILVVDAANDNGAMRSMVENSVREALNPVDQWRGIERLVALGWTEEAIAVALALPVRQIRKLRLLANVLPAMLEQMALGDMPSEQQLRIIAAAGQVDQKEVWKAHKPKKGDTAPWWQIANALTKKRMYARDASFGDELAQAYGIEWVEDLFAPADQDGRYTTNVEGFLGAQHEWMTSNLPKRGAIVEVNSWGQPELPKKAAQVYGKPSKSDHTALYLDRDGKVQTVHYRLPETVKPKGGSAEETAEGGGDAGAFTTQKARPDVTQKGHDMIGDFRTDALHDALGRAPIEDDMLMALMVLAFAGQNVRVDSGADGTFYGGKRFSRHAVALFDEHGRLAFDQDTLRIAVRSVLIDVLSCRRGMSNSGMVSRIAGEAISADAYLPNMGSEEFLLCLSRQALEASCAEASVQPRPKVRETRAALVEHFQNERFVHTSARFAPPANELLDWIRASSSADTIGTVPHDNDGGQADDPAEDQDGQIDEPVDQEDLQDPDVFDDEELDQRAAA